MIFFNIQEVRDYLLQHGMVYTLRSKNRREGRDEAVKGDYKNRIRIATVHLMRILKEEVTNPQQLLPYVEKSGLYKPTTEYFGEEKQKTAVEWFNKAKELHKGEPVYLFAATIIRR